MNLLALLLALTCSVAAIAGDSTPDATAKFLAGLPVRGTALESYGLESAWAVHASDFDRAWTKLEERQLSKIRQWAPAFLGSAYTSQGPMFYMFSGPDFLYAHAFFPSASTYILCGTEPVGAVPDITKIPPAVLPSSLANLRKSLDSVLSWSFFITKDMRVDLTQTQLSGTLPLLYVFLARANCHIDSVELVSLDNLGTVVSGKGRTPGVKIVFSSGGGQQQTLYYFTTDLGNDGIKSNGGFMKFCEQQGNGVSLLKAASYLMHTETFSKVRDFLLAQSDLIIEDDSGIPYRYFTRGKWSVRLCGNYVGPIKLFEKEVQPDLAQAHAASHAVLLPFGFGYQWRPSVSSLVIATKTPATAAPVVDSAPEQKP